MDLDQRIYACGSDLSRTQKKIITSINKHPQNVCNMTLHQLALFCGVSDSSIVRFIGRLGYSGYVEFREALISRSGFVPTPRRNYRLTFIDRVIKAIDKSYDDILIIGDSPALSVASYFYESLRLIKRQSRISKLDSISNLALETFDLTKGSILFLFLFDTHHLDYCRFLNALSDKGVKIFCICRSGDPISRTTLPNLMVLEIPDNQLPLSMPFDSALDVCSQILSTLLSIDKNSKKLLNSYNDFLSKLI